ncbi:MAG: hypothetical protein GF331_06320 [Chitinivibrionales bacterium]|nr:hypothetical protein [Chitinivibrionales bacterium]
MTQFVMLGMNHGAREMGMAGAAIGMPNDLHGFRSNPAALGYVEQMQGIVSYRSVLLDIWSGQVAFGLPIRKTGFWSLNVVNLSEGDLDEIMLENGAPVETGRVWSSNTVAGSVTWAKVLWRTLSLGASIGGAYRYTGTEGEYYSADGFAVDLGLQYRIHGDRLVLGIAARNLGGLRSSYTDDLDKEPLPASIGAGISYVPREMPVLRIALDVEKTKGRYTSFEPAFEVAILRELLFIRGGFAFSTRDLGHAFDVLGGVADDNYHKSQWSTLCLGLGLQTAIREVDVAFDAAVELKTVQHASVGVSMLAGF